LKKNVDKLQLGQSVRIIQKIPVFMKGFRPQSSVHIYKINKIFDDKLPILYEIKDIRGDALKTKYYREQLIRVTEPEYWPINKVIRTRRRKGLKEYYVQFLDYDTGFNQWVKETDMKQIR
jgi:hypothetical protein